MSFKNRPEMIVFDAVGTLIHPRPPVAEVYERIGRLHGSKLLAPAIGPLFRHAFHEQDEIDRRGGWHTDEPREKARWRAIVESVLCDVPDVESCFCDLFDYFAQPESWACNPQAAIVLPRLGSEGYRLAIASNYDRRLRRVVAGLADLKPIRDIFVSSEIGWRKPSSEFFHALVSKAGVRPDRILYIGDDYKNDVLGASSAGLSAWLLSPVGPAAPGQVTSLTAILTVLNTGPGVASSARARTDE